jgi:hypothetical protein
MALWTRSSQATDEDDFFGTDDDHDSVQRQHCPDGHHLWEGLAVKEYAAVEERYKTLGYHETYESSQESTLQDGFTKGYCESFDTAIRIGSLLGQAAASKLLQQKLQPQNTSKSTLQNDTPYLVAASRIRNLILSANTAYEGGSIHDVGKDNSAAATEPRIQQRVLENLENEIKSLLGIAVGNEIAVMGRD